MNFLPVTVKENSLHKERRWRETLGSPLGKRVGGAHPDLQETVKMACHNSRTHVARWMRAAAVKYEDVARIQNQNISAAAGGSVLKLWVRSGGRSSGRQTQQHNQRHGFRISRGVDGRQHTVTTVELS